MVPGWSRLLRRRERHPLEIGESALSLERHLAQMLERRAREAQPGADPCKSNQKPSFLGTPQQRIGKPEGIEGIGPQRLDERETIVPLTQKCGQKPGRHHGPCIGNRSSGNIRHFPPDMSDDVEHRAELTARLALRHTEF